MFRDAYLEGIKAAAAKFALDPHDVLELAGLGLIAAPVAHSMVTNEHEESPAVTKLKHLSDLTGLGLLAGPIVHQMMQH